MQARIQELDFLDAAVAAVSNKGGGDGGGALGGDGRPSSTPAGGLRDQVCQCLHVYYCCSVPNPDHSNKMGRVAGAGFGARGDRNMSETCQAFGFTCRRGDCSQFQIEFICTCLMTFLA